MAIKSVYFCSDSMTLLMLATSFGILCMVVVVVMAFVRVHDIVVKIQSLNATGRSTF